MNFTSTRARLNFSSSQTITRGISEDGGLFVPQSFPALSDEMIQSMVPMSYKERAVQILSLYLTDYSREELVRCVDGAYTDTFDNNIPAPLTEVKKGMNILELWHGPTCAFKDMALQLLPHLLTAAVSKNGSDKTMVILVATSGDTGKAALDGFADVPGTKIIVFYPQNGVSAMQKLQMTSQKGNNVAVCAIRGNFDDAQTGVKQVFADESMKRFLAERNMEFSSANSINFGRLVPQIVYYVSAYCDLLKEGKIQLGDSINAAVPTGNFGNILAAVYAKKMGIPIHKFICASNRNKILTDFINTGVYDRNREFFTTSSPSMDILISSNLERLLYHLYGDSPEVICGLMNDLKLKGRYQLDADVLKTLQSEFYGGFCDDVCTRKTISAMFHDYHYLCDTHTAVAVNVYQQYVSETGDDRCCVIASTASPYKFASAVLPAVYDGIIPEDDFEKIEKLHEVSGMAIPKPLALLKNAEILHPECIDKTELNRCIQNKLG